jgi:hypothetical protein
LSPEDVVVVVPPTDGAEGAWATGAALTGAGAGVTGFGVGSGSGLSKACKRVFNGNMTKVKLTSSSAEPKTVL